MFSAAPDPGSAGWTANAPTSSATHGLHPGEGSGSAIEAIQALAGHSVFIASTRIYSSTSEAIWLANEYRWAAEAIDAQAQVGVAE